MRRVRVREAEVDWSSPEVCYAALDQCGRGPAPQLAVSERGARWRTVVSPPVGDLDAVAGTDDGRLLLLRRNRSGVVVDTWPGGVRLPDAPPPRAPRTVELRMLDEGEQPVVGVRYAAPLFTHCGIATIWFGGAPWRRTDGGPDVESGAGEEPPDGWPVPPGGATVYGYATLDRDGVLTYADDVGTVLATYERTDQRALCV